MKAGEDVGLENISNNDSPTRKTNSNPANQGISRPLLFCNIIPSSVLCHRLVHKHYLISFHWNCFTRISYRCFPSYIILYFFLF